MDGENYYFLTVVKDLNFTFFLGMVLDSYFNYILLLYQVISV